MESTLLSPCGGWNRLRRTPVTLSAGEGGLEDGYIVYGMVLSDTIYLLDFTREMYSVNVYCLSMP